ncbi:MAG: hypothetical protein IAE95_05320 [Chitinophagaceae bacterium]|nr:hypothetical protein [Chitinophagaceae bacterium]
MTKNNAVVLCAVIAASSAVAVAIIGNLKSEEKSQPTQETKGDNSPAVYGRDVRIDYSQGNSDSSHLKKNE